MKKKIEALRNRYKNLWDIFPRKLILGVFLWVAIVIGLSIVTLTDKNVLEQWFLDCMFTWRGTKTVSPEIVMIRIDDDDIESIGMPCLRSHRCSS
ncbi:CHASE2 domain protein, partial [Candidatus Magnetobacterium bavaricum]